MKKSDMGIQLGDRVKDRISGLTGIVVGKFEYLNGCFRIQVQPEELKDGKPIDGQIFDVEQLVLVKSGVHALSRPSGGPMGTPTRSSVSPKR